jgi:hypothetical protein
LPEKWQLGISVSVYPLALTPHFDRNALAFSVVSLKDIRSNHGKNGMYFSKTNNKLYELT